MTLTGEMYDLQEACSEAGCPICRVMSQAVDSYFDHLLYESVNDIYARAKLRSTWGFCNRHAQMMYRPGGALSIAIIYQDVLHKLMQVMEGATWQTGLLLRKNGAAALSAELAPRQPCPACVHQDEIEQAYTKALALHIHEPAPAEAFAASDGLCWRHLRLTLAKIEQRAAFEQLIQSQRAIWQRLDGELAEFIRKHDYRFSDEGMGAEGDSWRRVIGQIAGMPGMGGSEDWE